MRAAAGLTSFAFDPGFDSSLIVRASHLTGLQTALNQARGTLGMATTTFAPVVAGSTIIRAADIGLLRDLAR
jgi:hypothetical protein